jgi:hypothetical protein
MPTLRYTIHVDEAIDIITVSSCYDGGTPRRLTAATAGALSALRDPKAIEPSGAKRRLDVRTDGFSLQSLTAGDCVEYEVDLRLLPQSGQRGELSRYGRDVVVDLLSLLWLPERDEADARIEITYRLPKTISVSTPGQTSRSAAGAMKTVFRLQSVYWNSRLAFGRFTPRAVVVGDATLWVSILDSDRFNDLDGVLAWIRAGAEAVTTLYRRFPVPNVQVIVVPVGRNVDPVPWGEVMRGGGDAVHLYVDHTRTRDELIADWTLYHEFSHLLHPYIARDGAWLYEGIASYYQNVLRARAGLITHDEAWRKLAAGFRRGMEQTSEHRTLAGATRTMLRDRLFMRVYWSGAAIALLADVALRDETRGRQSLGTALAALSECCLPSLKTWTPHELMAKLDDITGTAIFGRLHERYVDSAEFPDLVPTYQRLGIHTTDTALDLAGDACSRELRDRIMRPSVNARGRSDRCSGHDASERVAR